MFMGVEAQPPHNRYTITGTLVRGTAVVARSFGSTSEQTSDGLHLAVKVRFEVLGLKTLKRLHERMNVNLLQE